MKKKLFTIVAFVALAMGFFCLNQSNKSSRSIISGNIEALTCYGDEDDYNVHDGYVYDARSTDKWYYLTTPRKHIYDENGNVELWGGFCGFDVTNDEPDNICIDLQVWG